VGRAVRLDLSMEVVKDPLGGISLYIIIIKLVLTRPKASVLTSSLARNRLVQAWCLLFASGGLVLISRSGER
jgi:hypothetical protein